ncbi:hypothetical protein D3C78_1336080 [compost metagenome]
MLAVAPSGPSSTQAYSRCAEPQCRLGRLLRSAGTSESPSPLRSVGLATTHWVLLAKTFITRSLLSNGGKRTRSAISMPSWIRSTWRLLLSTCNSTSG